MTTVDIQTISGSSLAVGSSGARTLTIDRSNESGGHGMGFNGDELLLLAMAVAIATTSSAKQGSEGLL